jgi:hypothetical protein
MDVYEGFESLLPPPLSEPREVRDPQTGVEEDRQVSTEVGWKPVPVLACDGVRQLAVVVWARTKLLERTLVDHEVADARLLASLARIDAAIAVMSERLDALEDVLEQQAA